MDYLKQHRWKKTLFGIIGLGIIPIYGLLFSHIGPDGDLVLVTFSQIGSRYGGIEGLIGFGILSSLYYFLFLSYLFELTNSENPILHALMIITCISLLITVFLPYQPQMFPVSSFLHNYLAYLAATAFVITLLFYSFSFFRISQKLFWTSLAVLLLLVGIIVMVLLIFNVSSLFQLVFSTSMCIYMFLILVMIERSNCFDIEAILKQKAKRRTVDYEDFW